MRVKTVTALLTDPASTNALSTLFVIDDDGDIRRAICRLAQAEGLAVEGYASAPSFLEHYDPQKPGCIVLDIRMPGMSGLELQKALSIRGSCPPIIFVSAHGEIPLAIQALRDGAVDFTGCREAFDSWIADEARTRSVRPSARAQLPRRRTRRVDL